MKHFEDFEKEAKQYDQILKRYKEKGIVFTDPTFHPQKKIKETEVTFDEKDTIWERLDKYFTAPLFKKSAISESGIQQGELGTCYLIASLSRIARQPELVESLFDTRTRTKSNNKKGKDTFDDTINLKCGAVIVYLHAFGRLTPVLIDTLVPFKRGTRKPKLCHPSDLYYSPWFCLVEKAFAKLYGSFTAISGGKLSSAIYHLFGYFPCYKSISSILSKREQKLKKEQDAGKSKTSVKFNENEYLFSQLMRWQRENVVLGADITISDLRNGVTEDEIIDNGLVTNHAYLIMKVRREENKNFICLRNPWGDHEWLGDWSDTSPLWTPELKRALGVTSKNDGIFWMIDKDFFKYFSSFDVAKPVNPEYHCKSYMVKLLPEDYDGCQIESLEAHFERHQTFAVRLKGVQIKSDTQNESEASKGNIKTVDDIKVYIRIEKRTPYIYSDDPQLLQTSFAMYVAYSDGQKLIHERIPYYNRYWLTTNSKFYRSTIHVKENKPFVIVCHRTTKRDFIEECYVQVSCKYDFDLYDVDHPDRLMKEDEKYDIVFNNKSKRYSNISKDLRVKKIDGKDIQAFATTNTIELSETFYKHLEYKQGSDDSSGIYEYNISDDSEDDRKSKKKKGKMNKKDDEKEKKKINEEKKKIKELEKQIQKEKEKLEQEKKQMEKQKEQIEKENQRLEEEKKKLEEEKKTNINDKSSQKARNSNEADKNEKSESNNNSEDNSEISVEIRDSDSEDSQESESKSANNQKTSGMKSTEPKESKIGQAKRDSKSNITRADSKRKVSEDSGSDGEEQKSSKRSGRKALNRANSKRKVSEYSESDDEDKKPSKGRNKKALNRANARRKVSEYSESDDEERKPSKGNAKKALNRANSKRKVSEYLDSDDEERRPSKGSAKKALNRNTRRKVSEYSESDDEDKKSSKGRNKKAFNRANARRKVSEYSESDDENRRPSKGSSKKALNHNARRKVSEYSYSDDEEREPPKGGRVRALRDTSPGGSSRRRRIVISSSDSSSGEAGGRRGPARAASSPKRRSGWRGKDTDTESDTSSLSRKKAPPKKQLTKRKVSDDSSSYFEDSAQRKASISDSDSYESVRTSTKKNKKQQRRARRAKDESDSYSDYEEPARKRNGLRRINSRRRNDSDSEPASRKLRKRKSRIVISAYSSDED